jgi:hypothetical protein
MYIPVSPPSPFATKRLSKTKLIPEHYRSYTPPETITKKENQSSRAVPAVPDATVPPDAPDAEAPPLDLRGVVLLLAIFSER